MRMYIKNLFTANEGKRKRYRRSVLPVTKVAMAQGSPIPGSTSNHTEISNTFQLLKQGEEKIQLLERYKNVTLVLGNTGAGKTTFLQWIAGDNDKLIAKEVTNGSGDYIIEDGNRIGNSTIKSKTIFPELVVHPRTDTAYYDCPGFSDTRSTSIDIAATYFVKKVADHAEHVKMIFVVSYPSVRKGVDRQDFMKLLRHATDFIKDIDKYHNSIAIMVTKIDNQYIRVGKGFSLVPDEKVIEAIGGFLQEVKQGLEERLSSAGISDNEKYFCEHAIKFVNTLLINDGKNYTRIGLFRRPDEAGPLSNITLLQEGKEHIDSIIYENLVFTSKNNSDFGYTISDKSKNDIGALVEGINNNVWSNIGNIAEHMQKHYRHSVEEMRSKISSFATSTKAVDANLSEAQKFLDGFNAGYNITTNLIAEVKNATADKLAEKISHSIAALGIDGNEEDGLSISKQGKFFEFLQVVSDSVLGTRPWDTLLQSVATYLSFSKTNIQDDINHAAEKIDNQIKDNITSIAQKIKEHYQSKMKSMVIQQLPAELNKGYVFAVNMKEEMKCLLTTQVWSSKLIALSSDGDAFTITREMDHVFHLGKYLAFLQIISDKNLDIPFSKRIVPFDEVAIYLKKSLWDVFLDNLHKKLSAYDVQKDRSKYNVADIADWGQEGKPQGIAVTGHNFREFLKKVEPFGVIGYNETKDIEFDAVRVEDLRQVSNLTLENRFNASCQLDKLSIKGGYIRLSEVNEESSRCKRNATEIFALNTIFIDEDLNQVGAQLKLIMIAPTWEVLCGDRKINLSGADGQRHNSSKAANGRDPGSNGAPGKPGLPGGSAGSFFGIGAAFVNGHALTITANGGKGSPGQDGGDGMNGRNGDSPTSYLDDYINKQRWCDAKGPQILGFECEVTFNHSCSDYTCDTWINIFGKQGTNGGDGGDGGWGSNGGKSGNITLMQLGNHSGISAYHKDGENGRDGNGGKGGQGGKYGDSVKMVWVCPRGNYLNIWREKWKSIQPNKGSGFASSGHNGKHGEVNGANRQSPEPAAVISNKVEIISDYQSYVRENLRVDGGGRFREALRLFSDQLNSMNSSSDEVKRFRRKRSLQAWHKNKDQGHILTYVIEDAQDIPVASSATKPTSWIGSAIQFGKEWMGKATGPTVLDLGDPWVDQADANGLLTWATLLVRKWTGYRPKVSQVPSHDPATAIALSIRSHEWVDAFMDQVGEQAQACGMEEATSAIFESPEWYTQAIETVRKKMATGQVDGIAAPLFEQVVQQNSSKIAKTTTSDQADQWLANVREALPKLEQQFLEQEVSLQNQCQEKERANITSKPDLSLLKQAICSMPPTDQLADFSLQMRNIHNTNNTFVQSPDQGNPYRKCAGL